MKSSNFATGLLLLGLSAGAILPARAEAIPQEQLQAVFKIHVTALSPDYAQPWQTGSQRNGNGSGFLIDGKRLLTNAHVVSDATFIEVQAHGDSRKHPVRVAFTGHDCDLALLEAEDPSIFDGLKPMELGEVLPELGEEVHAIGFPIGGRMLSLTRGVVSRIDMQRYIHSNVDSHLVMQTDAAINPGNSGGPVILGGKVVGVAFSGMTVGQNIGYVIPLPVVRHFLDDVADGHYHGYPELGVQTTDTRNPAWRRRLGLANEERGAIVTFVSSYGAAHQRLLAGDVLLSVDGIDIAPDSSVRLGNVSINFGELVERKQWGEEMLFAVWRSNRVEEVRFPIDNQHNPFIYPRQYDKLPEFMLVGGLLFTPVSAHFLETLGHQDPSDVQSVLYYVQRAERDNLIGDRRQFVMLGDLLPHSCNIYAGAFMYDILKSVNDLPIRELADIKTALSQSRDGFHVFRFESAPLPLVLDAATLPQADAEIKASYGLPMLERLPPPPSAANSENSGEVLP